MSDRQTATMAERALDQVLAESFPASDPPSWTPGMARPAPSVIVGSGPLRSERTFIDGLISLVAGSGVVLLVPLAILLVGVPIALVIRGLLEAFRWLLE